MDLIILGDFSGSVNGHEDFVIDAIQSFSSSINGGEGVRIGVILFSNNPSLVTELSNDFSGLVASTNKYRDAFATGSTNIASALQMAANLLLEENNDSRKLIVLISDGEVTIGTVEETLLIGKQMNSIGVGVCSVLVKSASSNPEFMKQVSGGCYVETDYNNLAGELKNLNICF